MTSIKGHNSFEKLQKIICNCPYLYFVSINALTKFYQNPSIGSQDIEHTVHAAKCYDQSRLITWNFESHVTFLRGFCVDITRK